MLCSSKTKRVLGWLATILSLLLVWTGTQTGISPAFSVQAAASSSSTSNTTRVSVHDPSIFYDSSSDEYYIYGSHLAQASSTDLRNWQAEGVQGYDNATLYVSENVEGTYYLQNKHSGLYLDVTDGSTENGTNIRQWSYNGSQAQQFRFVSTGDGYYYILTGASNFEKCVDVENGSAADGANVQQWSYNGFQAQQFQIVSDGDGYYHILTGASNFTKALNVDNNLTADGTNINQYQYTGAANQQFQIQKQADGTYAILSRNTNGLSGLDVYNWSDQPGGNVNLWNYWGGDCQKWLLEPV